MSLIRWCNQHLITLRNDNRRMDYLSVYSGRIRFQVPWSERNVFDVTMTGKPYLINIIMTFDKTIIWPTIKCCDVKNALLAQCSQCLSHADKTRWTMLLLVIKLRLTLASKFDFFYVQNLDNFVLSITITICTTYYSE